MNPRAYQLSIAATLRADGDAAGADALMALSPEEVADILLGTVTPAPRPTTFAEWQPYTGPEGGRGWTNGREVRYQPNKPDDDDGTGGGTDPHRQDIRPGIDQAARVLGGGTVGAMTGAALGGPLGAVVGGAIGVAAGSDMGRSVLGGIRAMLNRGEEPEDIARKVTAGDPEATAAVRETAREQVRHAAGELAKQPPADPAEIRGGWAQASAKMRAGDAAELGGHVEALASAREPGAIEAVFRGIGGVLGRLTGGALRLAFNAVKGFAKWATGSGKKYLIWAATITTTAAVMVAPPAAIVMGLVSPATGMLMMPLIPAAPFVLPKIGRALVNRAGKSAAAESDGVAVFAEAEDPGGPPPNPSAPGEPGRHTFAEAPDYTPAGPDGKRAVELLAASKDSGIRTLTEVCDRAVRRLLMLPNPANAAHLFEDDELARIAGSLAGGIATADLLGRSRVRRRAEMAERVQRFAEQKDDPGPPGPAPRPGLTWKRETQRWIRKGTDHAKELTRRAKDAPAKLRGTVKSYVQKKYAKLEARYGANGAKAIMAASMLLLPVPVPGASFVPIALAEAVRAIGKGIDRFAEGEPVSEELVAAVIEFVADLYAAAGEAAPTLDPARVRAALERDEVDDDDQPAETFADAPTHAGLCVRAADTGRVLMLRRADTPGDPAAGTWEFPGGGIGKNGGREPARSAARREWAEEVGRPVPDGTPGQTWLSGNGVYTGHVWEVPTEAGVDLAGRTGDRGEEVAWRDPGELVCDDIRRELKADAPKVLAALGKWQGERFAESFADDPWHDFAEPVPAVEPRAAVDYFRRLVPSLADDPGRYGPMLGRHAFTLAVATEQTLLQKVKDAILAGLRTGVDATPDVQDVLDAAGVSPKNPQYAEMVWRTSAHEALNAGAEAEMDTPEMQEAFPGWAFDGIVDDRTGDDHRPMIGRYYPASRRFSEVRGPRIFNCRCGPRPVHRSEWADLIRAGKVERG